MGSGDDFFGETRYARNGDVHLAYRIGGDGEVPLVIAPGYISHVEQIVDHPTVARFYEQLGRFARVVIFDRRGTGLSDPIPGDVAPDLETRASDIGAVMDEVGFADAVLEGNSEGAPMCILFATTHPERTRALVLYGAMARTTYADDHPWLPAAEVFVESGAEMYAPKWGQGVAIDASAPTMVDDADAVRFYAKLERLSISPGMLASVSQMFYDTDVRDLLPTIRVPTLVLHRRGDRVVNVRSGRYLAQHIPGAKYVELSGIDHVPWFEGADEIVAAIEEFTTGRRAVAEPDRRLATVLFSDIVASTQRAAALGDAAWRDLLDRHNEIVTTAIERHRGTAVKSTGDGYLATFDGPASAIRCAVEMRDATGAIGLALRVGMHCGEVEVMGEDVGGIAVHIAARVNGLAGPGDVLVSRTVKDLVVGSGIEFDGRGAQQLRGVPDAWELYAVRA